MTIPGLVIGTIVSQALFILTKVGFLGYLNMDNTAVKLLYFVALIVVTTAIIRRMGVINYIECFFTAILWLLFMLIADVVITSSLIGRDMYHHIYFWLSYLAPPLAIIFFHKALHVEVRRGNIEKM